MEALTAQLPVPAETMPAEPMAEQPAPGLTARLGNTLRTGYEAVTDRIEAMKDKAATIAAIGGIAFVGAQAAELTANPEPVAAEGNTPALATSQQECIDDATAQPKIKKTEMRHAGVPGAQDMYAQVISNDQPVNCQNEFGVTHAERYRFRVQNSVHRARWSNFLGGWSSFNRGYRGGFRAVHLTSQGKHDKGLYKCSKGSKTTNAAVEIEELAIDTQTNQPLSKSIYKKAIEKILPKRC